MVHITSSSNISNSLLNRLIYINNYVRENINFAFTHVLRTVYFTISNLIIFNLPAITNGQSITASSLVSFLLFTLPADEVGTFLACFS